MKRLLLTLTLVGCTDVGIVTIPKLDYPAPDQMVMFLETVNGSGSSTGVVGDTYYYVPGGAHEASMTGTGSLNLYLFRYDFLVGEWQPVAWSVEPGATEYLTYTGAGGHFILYVHGTGSWDVTWTTPELRPTSAVATFVGAGDIARAAYGCGETTAVILDTIPGTVFALGDNAYEDGSALEYADCYDPSWGRHKARTQPTSGNHEYQTPGATGYFDYFSVPAYYSFNLGDWHIVSLDSEIMGQAQLDWLDADLEASDAACTLAMYHRPRWSSGPHGGDARSSDWWRLFYTYGTDVVLVGHDHIYERFSAQNYAGQADSRGTVQFTVGTGGGGLYPVTGSAPNSIVNQGTDDGVLKLTLRSTGYDFEFVGVGSFTDAGSATCH